MEFKSKCPKLPGVKFCAGEGGEGSGRRGEVVELGWNGGSWWEKCWRENRVLVLQCQFNTWRGWSTVGILGTLHG
uniref:Uncharacterized protein n=1 Tax=Tanacetum cinerariifolium TaxID=118510 RepID=A0A699JHP5_TANCI|nr:hypothetical protein [Tanacetum cinerariifolium]